MKILIVDDSKAMRLIVKRALRQAGFGSHAVVEACNGREALQVIDAEGPAVVLSDWNMPEMTGIELLEALGDRAQRPVFGFVTSEGTQQMRGAAFAGGASFFIVKPFTSDAFEQALSEHLG